MNEIRPEAALLRVLDESLPLRDRIAALDHLSHERVKQICVTTWLPREIRVEAYRRGEYQTRAWVARQLGEEDDLEGMLSYDEADEALERDEARRPALREQIRRLLG